MLLRETNHYPSLRLLWTQDVLISLLFPKPRVLQSDALGEFPLTGGKGQYTQWVHCELIVGPETIHPAHTQRVNSGHIQKVPTHLPSPNPAGKLWALLKSTHQFTQ